MKERWKSLFDSGKCEPGGKDVETRTGRTGRKRCTCE
jgi:hypothetical protein